MTRTLRTLDVVLLELLWLPLLARGGSALFLIPTLDWVDPAPPLKNRDYVSKASEPELGVELPPTTLTALDRYAWRSRAGHRLCS